MPRFSPCRIAAALVALVGLALAGCADSPTGLQDPNEWDPSVLHDLECGDYGEPCEIDPIDVCISSGDCGGGGDPAEDWPDDDPAPVCPSGACDGEGGGGGSGGPAWWKYADPLVSDDGQLYTCDGGGEGVPYGGKWQKCNPQLNQGRDEQVEKAIRASEDQHIFCRAIADEWSWKSETKMTGWFRETIRRGPNPEEIQLGHHHDVVEPIGHIHIFEGNDLHPRTFKQLVETAVHETLHSLGYGHGETIMDGIKFGQMEAICSAGLS